MKKLLFIALLFGCFTTFAQSCDCPDDSVTAVADGVHYEFFAYPNPFNNVVVSGQNAELFDSSGRIVAVFKDRLDATELRPGLYFIRIIHNNHYLYQKMVKL